MGLIHASSLQMSTSVINPLAMEHLHGARRSSSVSPLYSSLLQTFTITESRLISVCLSVHLLICLLARPPTLLLLLLLLLLLGSSATAAVLTLPMNPPGHSSSPLTRYRSIHSSMIIHNEWNLLEHSCSLSLQTVTECNFTMNDAAN